ncbi:MAG: hypothetical protein KC491_01245 [Dehalococcoidia bacterium]|nr:hypothetical protein [Dehalococcoidia bacterium]
MPDEDTTAETATETAETPEAPKPTETVEFWKQKAREQEKKAKENVAARLELDELKKAQLSNEEKLAAELGEAAQRAARAEAEALRWRIAARHGISDEDAELFLTGSDEETLSRQAERFRELAVKPQKGTHVPGIGNKPSAPASIADQIAAAEQSGDQALAIRLKAQRLAELARNNH